MNFKGHVINTNKRQNILHQKNINCNLIPRIGKESHERFSWRNNSMRVIYPEHVGKLHWLYRYLKLLKKTFSYTILIKFYYFISIIETGFSVVLFI